MNRENLKKRVWGVIGLVCFALGSVGIVMPVLPTAPLYLASLYAFSRSSDRLRNRFLSSPLLARYTKHFRQKKMTRGEKLRVLGTVSIVMGFAYLMMKETLIGRVILVCVWLGHVFYFLFVIRTVKEGTDYD